MLGNAIQKELAKTSQTFFAPSSRELNLLDSKSIQDFFQNREIDLILYCKLMHVSKEFFC